MLRFTNLAAVDSWKLTNKGIVTKSRYLNIPSMISELHEANGCYNSLYKEDSYLQFVVVQLAVISQVARM